MKRIFAVVAIGVIIVLCGCGGGAPEDTNPPFISDVQVEPTDLPRFTGGQVIVSAKVSDSSGVSEVWAEVKKPDGAKERVTMNLVGGVYQGTITASANTRSDGQKEIYKVWVLAKDVKGNETPALGLPTDGKTFTVPSPLKPPDEPEL